MGDVPYIIDCLFYMRNVIDDVLVKDEYLRRCVGVCRYLESQGNRNHPSNNTYPYAQLLADLGVHVFRTEHDFNRAEKMILHAKTILENSGKLSEYKISYVQVLKSLALINKNSQKDLQLVDECLSRASALEGELGYKMRIPVTHEHSFQ